jgi:hypothetical protein
VRHAPFATRLAVEQLPVPAGDSLAGIPEASSADQSAAALGTSPSSVNVVAVDGSGSMVVSPSSVVQGASQSFTFTYMAAAGGTDNGIVEVEVPSGWTAPQTGSGAGYASVVLGAGDAVGDSVGSVTVGPGGAGTIEISGVTLAGGDTLVISYGEVSVPSAAGSPYTFQNTESLTVKVSGARSGAVTSSPAGINCGPTCAGSFVAGSLVKLSATPAAGSAFSHWSGGGCSGTRSTCTIPMRGAEAVSATFTVLVTGQQVRCGEQQRGQCLGLVDHANFRAPGNSVWAVFLYGGVLPRTGASRAGAAHPAVAAHLVLLRLSRRIRKAGPVTLELSLIGNRIARLFAQGRRQHLTHLAISLNFTTTSGRRTTVTRKVR